MRLSIDLQGTPDELAKFLFAFAQDKDAMFKLSGHPHGTIPIPPLPIPEKEDKDGSRDRDSKNG